MISNCCDPCAKPKCCGDPCGCPLRTLSVDTVTDMPGYVKYNLDGKTVSFDHKPVTQTTETKTAISVDLVNRVLKYLSESGAQTITASELGSLLRLGDLGDVATAGATNNALLTYRKNSECSTGCDTSMPNQWVAYDSLENIEDSAKYLLSFDENGAPKTLGTPATTSEYYYLGWNGPNMVQWTQPVEVATPSADDDGYSYIPFVSPRTKQLEMLRVVVDISSSGDVTFNINGGQQ